MKALWLFVAGTYMQVGACIMSRYWHPDWTAAIVAILVVCGSFVLFYAGNSARK